MVGQPDTMRSLLIWKMAKAAHDAHYCGIGAHGGLCENCKEDGKCFELSGGFKRDDHWEWYHSAKFALEVLETEMDVTFHAEDKAEAAE